MEKASLEQAPSDIFMSLMKIEGNDRQQALILPSNEALSSSFAFRYVVSLVFFFIAMTIA